MAEATGSDEAVEAPAPPVHGTGPEPAVVDLTTPKRQRRPTGAPAPLPKKIGLTGVLWLAAALVIVVSGSVWLHVSEGPLDRFDAVFSRAVVGLRAGWLDSLARGLNSIGSKWGLAGLGLATVALVAFFRRFRHLLVFLLSLAVPQMVWDFPDVVAPRALPALVT